MVFYVNQAISEAPATVEQVICICICTQGRHRSVASCVTLAQVLSGRFRTTVSHDGRSNGSWSQMTGRCRGFCETCQHSTHEAEMAVVAQMEKVDEYLS